MNDSKLSILIAGDMVPTKSNERLFIDGNMSSLFGDSLHTIFQEADIVSVNLECPLTVSDYRYQVRIPHFPQKPASEAFRLRFRDFGYRVKLPRNPQTCKSGVYLAFAMSTL